jgi:hypothetical protein
MVAERVGGGPEGTPPTASGISEGAGLPPSARLQILTTEHWSLLATRGMTWNEAFSRAQMFLSALSGGIVALALASQAMGFGSGFIVFALLLLPVLLFLGLATFVRLVDINNEDNLWVAGMNILRRAYLDAAPELERYFISGTYDDEASIMRTFGATPGSGAFVHGFVTTPGMLAVVDAVLAAVLAGTVGIALHLDTGVVLVIGVITFLVSIALLVGYQFRAVVIPWREYKPRYPAPPGK